MAVACVLGAVGAWHILRAAGLLLRIAYSVGGQALLLGARLGSCCVGVFWVAAGLSCGARVLWVLGACLRGMFRVSAPGLSCLL